MPRSRLSSSIVSPLLLAMLTLLLVEVLLEAWVQEVLGNRHLEYHNLVPVVVGQIPDWPKQLKNALLIALVLLSLLKVGLERRWREFTTRADLAVVVVMLVMVLAGALGTSGPTLIVQAVFVYMRGAIVFYAVRALRPTWPQVRLVFWIIGGIVAVDVLVAAVQLVVGTRALTGVGWVDTQQADDHRWQGLLDHPNHLGQVIGLALIGIVAYLSGSPSFSNRTYLRLPSRVWWWVAVGAGALGIAASQSRETVLALLAAIALIWVLRRAPLRRAALWRGAGRPLLTAALLIVVFFGAYVVAVPGNLSDLIYRLRGVNTAVTNQAGTEDCAGYASSAECTAAGAQQPREIRLLFWEQGLKLIEHRPVLGYGVGQFGGIVAEKYDAHWETDPRFQQVLGGDGFNLYDWDGTTVDSHWLHLTVEIGILGLLVYLVWLWFIAQPLLRTARLRAARAPTPSRWVALWGSGAMVFTLIVAFFSNTLDDPLYPPLAFAIFGLGWVLARDLGHPAPPRPDDSTADAVGSAS